MLARKLDPADCAFAAREPGPGRTAASSARRRAAGRWREQCRRPTRGPSGEVRWWERPAPGGHDLLWAAVCRLQERRLAQRTGVTELARRLAAADHPIRRETLSRILNGKQRTTWETVDVLALQLEVELGDLSPAVRPRTRRQDRAGAGTVPPGLIR